MINKDYIMLFFNMSFSEKTDSEVMRKNYTDRHKRRLAHKKSTNEFKRICNKIKQNRTCNTSANNNNDQIDLLFGNSCTDMENTYLQHTDNIYVQVPAENCDELINEETFNNYSTSIETEIQSENQENNIENAEDTENIEINQRDSDVANNISAYKLEENDFKSEIKQWTADHKICLNALTSLLRIILNKKTNTKFPKNRRTLMSTPRTLINCVTSMDKGSYCHFGVKPAIYKMIENRISSKINNLTINLIVYIYRWCANCSF
ncbi:uncharacterized protein LOC120359209 isoform X1 [Solenopsis invicta]|uniref:uncharacterized protein LOC120359209 isoform X1 n=1 Tax=Solenopsis invicta TaxID=13686 RepID=UPI00193DED57|nr:uncharacterized protein LOC120359209 isoform X1 [Solenopsis invicta]